MRTHHMEMALAEQPACSRRSRDIAELAADSAPHDSELDDADLDGTLDRDGLREHAEAMFGDAPDGITLQLDGRIVYANRRMAALTGHGDPDGLIGLSSLHFYSEDQLAPVLARLQSTFFGKPTSPARHMMRRLDGSKVEVEVACLLLTLASSPMLVEVVRGIAQST
jgi:PAS domain S-box-containing protein